MKFNVKEMPSGKGKITVVTGANTGLGYEISLMLAEKEYTVIMACRNLKKAKFAQEKIDTILTSKNLKPKLEVLELDLSKLKSVKAFVKNFLAKYKKLNLLINNAGIMIPPYTKTEDGFESQMATNYFGHFLLTGLLLKTINATKGARIVSLSSIAHKSGRINFDNLNAEKKYERFPIYAQSKLACLMFADELDRRLKTAKSNTLSVSAHPGVANTELFRDMPIWLTKLLEKSIGKLFAHSAHGGALPVVMAALDPTVKGGEYFGPTGFNDMKGPPGRAKKRKHALSLEVAKKLWEQSEELTKFKYKI